MSALACFNAGCFAAAETAFREMNLSKDCFDTKFLEKIRSTREAAMTPPAHCLVMNSKALGLTIAHLTCEAKKRQSRGLVCADLEELVGLLFADDKIVQGYIAQLGYPALYIEAVNCLTTTKEVMMQKMIERNNRESAWRAIQDGHRRCPFIAIWHGVIELNDCTCTIPPLLVFARIATQPHISKKSDSDAAHQLLSALDVSSEADAPTLRWWTAYMQMDAEEWDGARDTLETVLFDCTNGIWPPHYIPEALYHSALAEFALDHAPRCAGLLRAYFDLADALDRNRADATLLRLWAERHFPPRPPTLQLVCRRALAGVGPDQQLEGIEPALPWNDTERTLHCELPRLRTALAKVWGETAFAHHTWARARVSEALGIREAPPYRPLAEALRRSWDGVPQAIQSMRPPHLEALIGKLEASGGRDVTIRYHRSPGPRGDGRQRRCW